MFKQQIYFLQIIIPIVKIQHSDIGAPVSLFY